MIHSAPVNPFLSVRTNCQLLGATCLLQLSKQFCCFPSYTRGWLCSHANSSPPCSRLSPVSYSVAAITTTMPGKRSFTAPSGDVEVLVKRSKLSGSVRSVSPNEATLPRRSVPVIDLTSGDGKPELPGHVEVPGKEPSFSRGARNPTSNFSTPSRSPIQIVDLTDDSTDDELDLNGFLPRGTAPSNASGECDMAIPKHGGPYDLAGKYDKLQPQRIHNQTGKSDMPRHERVSAYDTCFGLVCSQIRLSKTAHST